MLSYAQTTLLIVLLGTATFLFLNDAHRAERKAIKGKSVALTGAPDAGKTSIFSVLALQDRPATHTSLTPSSSTIRLPSSSSSLTLIDLPGHPRMRSETEKTLRKDEVRGVVFVVDVAALVRNAATVAEDLVPVLTALAAKQSATPPRLLIIANKTDLLIPTSSTANGETSAIPSKTRQLALDRLTTLLTRELTRIKSSRLSTSSSRIEGIDRVASSSSGSLLGFVKRFFTGAGAVEEKEAEADGEAVWGGAGPFEFKDVEGVEVEFAVGSAVREGGLGEVYEWLGDL